MCDISCPVCRSASVIEGEMFGGGEFGNTPASTFVPRGMKWFRMSRGIEMDVVYAYCKDCRLLWKQVPPETAKEMERFLEENVKT